ncbi:hypothetical protein G6F46_011376 [Rhizopus delemar]|uniref:Uncharacterized protein n=2 Tax=Rhizopus TaxID=4842 RepID=A0A9P6YTE5_9FUNG|nr:hypothetical protein G6F55_010856 [Rhizopus delemar]KAG1535549.1 hypothetical protein G6F51_011476 [Rhizopus arrhizus]KAG1517303.1 hypothetical protein G6F52_009266 [Rhizopus delemar]KAG1541939.1 hypothetical protein G6F49_011763 [Rhizopus delemar]KAG1564173.1 hypothetical protein G6F50_011280 [Rhizopus delemar]
MLTLLLKTDVVVGEEETVVKTVEEVTGVTGVIAGTVTETIVKDKDTVSAIDTIVKESDSVDVEVVVGDKKTKTVVDTTTITDETKPDTVTTGVVVGAVTEAIVTDKEVTTVVEDIVKKTDTVDVDVIVGEQEVDTITKDKTTSDSHIDVIVKETKQVVDDKKTVVDVSETESSGVIAGAVTEAIVSDKKVASAVESIVTDAESVTVEIVGGDKKVDTVVDTSAVGQVASKVDTVKKTDISKDFENVKDTTKDSVTSKVGTVAAGIVAGAVVEAIANDKPSQIETTVRESKGTIVEVTADDKKSEVVIGEVDIEDATVSKIDVTVKETVNSDVISVEDVVTDTSATVITGTTTEAISTDKETSPSVEVITGDKKVDTVFEITTEDKINIIVKDSDASTTDVIVGEVETVVDVRTETVTTGIVTDAVVEAISKDKETLEAIQAITKNVSSIDVDVIVTDKTQPISEGETSATKIEIIIKDITEVVDTEGVVISEKDTEGVVGSVSSAVTDVLAKDKETLAKIDAAIKESDSVIIELVAGEKKAGVVVDTTVEKVTIDETDVVKDTSSVPVDHEKDIIRDTVTEIITGDKETGSAIETIVKESDSITVVVGTAEKKVESVDTVTENKTIVDSTVDDVKHKSDTVVDTSNIVVETEVADIISDTVVKVITADKEIASTIKESDSVIVEVSADDKKSRGVIDVPKKEKKTTTETVEEIITSETKAPTVISVDVLGDKDVVSTVKETSSFEIVSDSDKKIEIVEASKPVQEQTVIEFVTKNEAVAAGVVVGTVTEAVIRDQKVVSAIEDIVKKYGDVSIEVVTTEKPTGSITADSKIGIIIKETEIVNNQRIKEIETAPVDATGIIASAVAERIVKDKETASKVGNIIEQSDSVAIEVIAGTTVTQNVIDVTDVVIDETQVKTEIVSIPEAITAGVIAGGVVSAVIGSEKVLSNVDTIVKGSGSFDIEVITDKDTDKVKPTSQIGFVLKESAPVDSTVTKKDNTSIGAIVARTIAESVLGNKDTSSVVGNTAQTSDAIAIQIISGDEKVETVVDTTTIVTEEIDIVEKVVTETVANDIKEISVIDTKKPKSVDIIDEKTTAIIEDKTIHTSQVDVIQKETDQCIIGDKKTVTKPNTGVSKTEGAVAAVIAD